MKAHVRRLKLRLNSGTVGNPSHIRQLPTGKHGLFYPRYFHANNRFIA
jgi:hypothetical protein